MMSELIDKIKTLKKKNKVFGYGDVSVRKQGYNDAISDVIKIVGRTKWIELYLADDYSGKWIKIYPESEENKS